MAPTPYERAIRFTKYQGQRPDGTLPLHDRVELVRADVYRLALELAYMIDTIPESEPLDQGLSSAYGLMYHVQEQLAAAKHVLAIYGGSQERKQEQEQADANRSDPDLKTGVFSPDVDVSEPYPIGRNPADY